MSVLSAQQTVSKYLRTGIVVDSGLLILLIIGRYERAYIANFKITSSFDQDDYDILSSFISRFRNIVISPHVLAELSNHSFKLPHRKLGSYLDVFIELVRRFDEKAVTKESVLSHENFKKLGVTDTGLIISCLEGPYLLLTSDRKLIGIAKQNGVDALHFNELRGYYWFAS